MSEDHEATFENAIEFLWKVARQWPHEVAVGSTLRISRVPILRIREATKALRRMFKHRHGTQWTDIQWWLIQHQVDSMAKANLLHIGDVQEHVNWTSLPVRQVVSFGGWTGYLS